jgi:nitroreductase
MNVDEALTTRATVHAYRDEPIGPGVVEEALATTLAAPNHRMTEPWRFLRVGRATRKRLVDLQIEINTIKADGKITEQGIEAVHDKILNPAELIVAVCVRSDDSVEAREDYAAVACAIQNLTVSLWSKNVGAKWSTGAITKHEKTYEIFGLDAAAEEIVGFVWAGAPLEEPVKPPRQRGVEDIVRVLP